MEKRRKPGPVLTKSRPIRASELPRAQRQSIVQRCAAVIAIVSSAENDEAPQRKARVLNALEAAEMMGKPVAWMKSNGRTLPGAIKIGKTWGWSEETLAKYIRTREGR